MKEKYSTLKNMTNIFEETYTKIQQQVQVQKERGNKNERNEKHDSYGNRKGFG